MCGRYTLSTDLSSLQDVFPGLAMAPGHELRPRYNVAPTQPVPVVRNDGTRRVELVRWGLIPWWADDPTIGNRMINARAETLARKAAFRDSLARRRCLVLADGFFEWQLLPGHRRKTPMLVRLKSQKPFAFAGLWDSWRAPDGEQTISCTIVTTQPNELVAPIHDRMPVILRPEDVDGWIVPEVLGPEICERLTTYPAVHMETFPVSARVNDVANDDPECVTFEDPVPDQRNYDLFQ